MLYCCLCSGFLSCCCVLTEKIGKMAQLWPSITFLVSDSDHVSPPSEVRRCGLADCCKPLWTEPQFFQDLPMSSAMFHAHLWEEHPVIMRSIAPINTSPGVLRNLHLPKWGERLPLVLLVPVSDVAKKSSAPSQIEGETKWPPFSRRHFQMPFLNKEKMYEFRLRFYLSLFPRVQLTTFQHWYR